MSRHKAINLLVNTDEYAEIQAAAQSAEQPISTFVRELVMEQLTNPVRTKPRSKRSKEHA